MNEKRKLDLETNSSASLTLSEIAHGWHFCPKRDGKLSNSLARDPEDPGEKGRGCGCVSLRSTRLVPEDER